MRWRDNVTPVHTVDCSIGRLIWRRFTRANITLILACTDVTSSRQRIQHSPQKSPLSSHIFPKTLLHFSFYHFPLSPIFSFPFPSFLLSHILTFFHFLSPTKAFCKPAASGLASPGCVVVAVAWGWSLHRLHSLFIIFLMSLPVLCQCLFVDFAWVTE